ncbi:MAG: suppressor of fused domain protein [Clostridium argentinense]|uniref:Suppressor of fused domain protein n=1 Tax=Clostridium faecium TaxID=2762223 RepID=A0ABR8YRV3_9CLOT|nr:MULTISPECIES: suppressor of fused domain protein [Clostridium]MBD8046954.1 suppressor of fused domain protein [Clostridium faecium]MBS5823157.1 suppressor of fused domain protein [Clostridium argentinense]MDU1349287.1 suppressor of fused domain protein [Clostridium argentinense]
MGFLDKLNKKIEKKDNRNDEVIMGGWRAIEDVCLKMYPGQNNPKHYGTIIPWSLGGNDPLDGISIYDGGEYYHFVTFGLSELYEKESKNKEYSGYGFELTVKLKKDGLEDEEAGIRGMCGILQAIAKITYNNDEIFQPDEYIYTGQTTGMDPSGKSLITGFITHLDKLGEIETPNGKVQFVELIGATDAELKAIIDKKLRVKELFERLGSEYTDYKRESLF